MTDSAPNPNASLAERIAIALNAVERTDKPGSWLACCPCHDDTKPSFSITNGDGGRPLLYCHAGCDYENVVAALEQRGILIGGWQDHLPSAAPRPPPKAPELNAAALRIWREASPVKAGGIVDRYLKGRGLMLSCRHRCGKPSLSSTGAWNQPCWRQYRFQLKAKPSAS
jgi:hypothetical protein